MSTMFGPNKYARPSLEDTDWAPFTLLNGWVDYSTTGGTYRNPAAYRRLGGVVYVDGLIKNGTTTTGTVLANLPAGFRPAWNTINIVFVGPTLSFGRVDVATNGDLILQSGATSFTSLSLTPFIAEQ